MTSRIYPGGWRSNTQATRLEEMFAYHTRQRELRNQERHKPLVMMFNGQEFGRRTYLHRLAAEMSGVPYNHISNRVFDAFLGGLAGYGPRRVERKRIPWGVYYNVAQFSRSWQKRIRGIERIRKKREERLQAALLGAGFDQTEGENDE